MHWPGLPSPWIGSIAIISIKKPSSSARAKVACKSEISLGSTMITLSSLNVAKLVRYPSLQESEIVAGR